MDDSFVLEVILDCSLLLWEKEKEKEKEKCMVWQQGYGFNYNRG
jgi:hypothetical protein